MNKIKIREDLLNQYINQTSNLTFRDLQDNYNHMIELLNVASDNRERYVVCLIDTTTGKYLEYTVDNIIYDDKLTALQVAKQLNATHSCLREEYCIEIAINNGVTKLANLAYEMLKG